MRCSKCGVMLKPPYDLHVVDAKESTLVVCSTCKTTLKTSLEPYSSSYSQRSYVIPTRQPQPYKEIEKYRPYAAIGGYPRRTYRKRTA